MAFVSNEKLVYGSSISRLVKLKNSGHAITYIFRMQPYVTLNTSQLCKMFQVIFKAIISFTLRNVVQMANST